QRPYRNATSAPPVPGQQPHHPAAWSLQPASHFYENPHCRLFCNRSPSALIHKKENDRCVCNIRFQKRPVCNTEAFHSIGCVTGDNAASCFLSRSVAPEPADYFAACTLLCLILFSPF